MKYKSCVLSQNVDITGPVDNVEQEECGGEEFSGEVVNAVQALHGVAVQAGPPQRRVEVPDRGLWLPRSRATVPVLTGRPRMLYLNTHIRPQPTIKSFPYVLK